MSRPRTNNKESGKRGLRKVGKNGGWGMKRRSMCAICAGRIAAICLMGKGPDENYSAVKGACWEWGK